MPLLALALCAIALFACGGDSSKEGADRFDGERAYRDLVAQVEIGPRPAGSAASQRTALLIARRLRQAGAEDVQIQTPNRNVVGVVRGRGEGDIVVGAHHDTKDHIPGFVGANDGASGVAVVLELARVFAERSPLDGPSLRFVLFDAEEARGGRPFTEDGTRGSAQFVSLAEGGGGQGAPPLEDIDAMVLFDLVGDCDLELPREANSDPQLYDTFAAAAAEVDGDEAPFEGEVPAILDDHLPFLEAGVPAVDVIDLRYGPGERPGAYWHTPEDTLDKVCVESLDAVGEAAVRALERIGR